jgi:pyruvate,water dikinase
VRRFFTTYEQFKVELDRYPPDDLGAHELHALLDRFMAELLPLYSVQIFNDFLAQQLFELVATLIERFGLGDDVVRLRNELFCGEEGVESVDPVRSALRLAQQVRSDAALRSLFEGPEGSEAVWFEVAANPRLSAFYAACEEHIRDYGDRTLEELKLETDPLGERPHDLVPALRNYLQGGQNVDDMTARERRIRNQAEKQVRAALRAHPVRRLMFGFVLRHARWGVKQRENLRLGRSRCFGFAKRLYRAIGHRLAEADLIDDPRDVFWLTREEVDAMTRGTIIDGDVRRLIRSRQADYEGWRHERLSSRIVTSGIAAAHPHVSELSMPDDAVVLHGVGCSPGTAKARALALTEPDSRVRVAGEILVAAATDPGWVFLMVAAGGLVSEKGSVLSHTAIIGRELGIPTVVGVAAATQRLADRVVLLDGGAGTVTIVEE